jgi:hypothetical protein
VLEWEAPRVPVPDSTWEARGGVEFGRIPSMSRCYLQAIIRALQVADGRAAVLQGGAREQVDQAQPSKIVEAAALNGRPCEFIDAGSSDDDADRLGVVLIRRPGA